MAASIQENAYPGGYVYTVKVPANADKATLFLDHLPRSGAYAAFGDGRGIGLTFKHANAADMTVKFTYGDTKDPSDAISPTVSISGQHRLVTDPSITKIEFTAIAADANNVVIVNSPAKLKYEPNWIKPQTPALSAVPGDTKLTITAALPGAQVAPITKWQYRRAAATANFAGAWTDVAQTDYTVTFDVGSLTNGTAYKVQVRAVHGTQNGDAAIVTGTPKA